METIVNWLMGGSVTVIGIIIGYFITKNEYTFQKRYDRKFVLITDLYQQVVRLEFELNKYLQTIGADLKQDSIDKKILALKEIKESFQEFQHKYWETEIILDENTIRKIQPFLTKYIEITSELSTANISQQLGDLNQSFDRWDKSFKSTSSELVPIKEDLKKEFRKTLNK